MLAHGMDKANGTHSKVSSIILCESSIRPRSASSDSAAEDLYALNTSHQLARKTYPFPEKTHSISFRTPESNVAWSTAACTSRCRMMRSLYDCQVWHTHLSSGEFSLIITVYLPVTLDGPQHRLGWWIGCVLRQGCHLVVGFAKLFGR